MELSDAKETGMQKLSYKHFEIQLEEGSYTVAAMITSGIPNQVTIDREKEILTKFENKFRNKLEIFTGDVKPFEATEELVNQIFFKK